MTIENAAATGTRVQIKTVQGRVLVGTPVRDWAPNTFRIRTGKRGRPAVVHADDVAEVTPE